MKHELEEPVLYNIKPLRARIQQEIIPVLFNEKQTPDILYHHLKNFARRIHRSLAYAYRENVMIQSIRIGMQELQQTAETQPELKYIVNALMPCVQTLETLPMHYGCGPNEDVDHAHQLVLVYKELIAELQSLL